MGRYQEAVTYGLKAFDFIDPPIDAITDPFLLFFMIEIYAIIGDYQSGEALVQDLLQKKALFTSQSLLLDPDIRNIFEDLITQLENR